MHKTCNESRTSSIYMLIVQCESDVNRLLTFKSQTTFDFEFYIRGSYTYRQIAWECDGMINLVHYWIQSGDVILPSIQGMQRQKRGKERKNEML